MTHMSPEELGKIVTCDLRLLKQSGQISGVEVVKRCVEEIKACWLEMETMKDKLKEFNKLLLQPKDDSQIGDGSRMWYE